MIDRFKYFALLIIFFLLPACGFAQTHELRGIIVNGETKLGLPGASVQVKGTNIGALSNEEGAFVLENLQAGTVTIVVRFVGFAERTRKLTVPYALEQPLLFELFPEENELDEIVITTTRSSRDIRSIPTRVEFIGAEELEEKITMQPGNIRMVLSESTGIQTQQTSVTSANTTIRIQGLEGRYTQLLKDGFPLYGGFSGGLSIMQIPPLDLQQVDLIKGSSSTLYGGGAIAGLVNLISKQPKEERELIFFANGTSAKGLDLSSYYGEKFKKSGVTVFASRNSNEAYDPSDQGFSAIPKFTRYTVNPRLFLYSKKNNTVMAGINASWEKRMGGDMLYLEGNGNSDHSYFEKNNTKRISTQFAADRKITQSTSLHFKNSFNIFHRDIFQKNYFFGAEQLSSFTELMLQTKTDRSDLAVGFNYISDAFREDVVAGIDVRDFDTNSAGFFINHVFNLSDVVILESGLRTDRAVLKKEESSSDWLVLPRISALLKISPGLTSRIGGGLGYKTPTIFTEKAEEQLFRNVRPLNLNDLKTERSLGANADVNYVTGIGDDFTLSINQLFFATRLNSPLIFDSDSLQNGAYYFVTSPGFIQTIGAETNLKVEYGDWKLFGGYTFVDAFLTEENVKKRLPLTARNRINAVLMYEIEGSLRLGLEAFYFSRQRLTDNTLTNDYWILGFSAQKKWKSFSLFINFENFTDTRQTRFDRLYDGSVTNPEFREVYAPLDGFVFNGGIFVTL